MLLTGMLVMFVRVHRVAMSNLRMVRCLLVAPGFMVLGGLVVVFGCLLVVMRRLLMMLVNVFHGTLRGCSLNAPAESFLAGGDTTVTSGPSFFCRVRGTNLRQS